MLRGLFGSINNRPGQQTRAQTEPPSGSARYINSGMLKYKSKALKPLHLHYSIWKTPIIYIIQKGKKPIQGILENPPLASSKPQDLAAPIASCQGADLTAA